MPVPATADSLRPAFDNLRTLIEIRNTANTTLRDATLAVDVVSAAMTQAQQAVILQTHVIASQLGIRLAIYRGEVYEGVGQSTGEPSLVMRNAINLDTDSPAIAGPVA